MKLKFRTKKKRKKNKHKNKNNKSPSVTSGLLKQPTLVRVAWTSPQDGSVSTKKKKNEC